MFSIELFAHSQITLKYIIALFPAFGCSSVGTKKGKGATREQGDRAGTRGRVMHIAQLLKGGAQGFPLPATKSWTSPFVFQYDNIYCGGFLAQDVVS
jgi:hypothetical protein